MNHKVNIKTKFQGIIPPLITPLRDDETLDEASFRRLIDYCIEQGVRGIFPMGSSGEAMNVSHKVWRNAIEVALDEARGRTPVFCGVIESCTQRVIENIKEAEQLGAEIVVATPAFYLKNTCQDEVIRHYTKICDSTGLEVVVYNIPNMTHVNILPETILEISRLDNIVAYKDSGNNWEQFQRSLYLLEDTPIAVFNGAEELCGVSMLWGATGCVPGLANFFPELFIDMHQAAMSRDVNKVYELQKEVWEIRKMLFYGKSWLSAMKYIASKLNLGSDKVTSPVQPLTGKERQRIGAKLEEYIR